MGEILKFFETGKAAGGKKRAGELAAKIAKAVGLEAYPKSLAAREGGAAFVARAGIEKSLLVAAGGGKEPSWVWEFTGRKASAKIGREGISITVCPLGHENAAALRRNFPFTAPRCFGTRASAGLGDRLGIATPGHIRAAAKSGLALYLAQQSIREMTRTGREARQVMDDATWGVFQEGWREGFGSDADHLKATADIDTCAAAGFTMYTIDPGEHVDNAAEGLDAGALKARFEGLDWAALETTAAETRREYLSKSIKLGGRVKIAADEGALLKAAVKYGAAAAHTAAMYRHLAGRMGDRPFELEVSVDETATPTSTFEHYFVARELRRLGVKWVSLAPRFVGEFEKGIDYKGNLKAFEKSFEEHVAVMRELGPYKMSIHSGSDKFSIYPIIARHAEGFVHLKTAGTSYLEALRVLADIAPDLFREILEFAFERYETDKKSYHVSADLARVPRAKDLADKDLSKVLDTDDGRQLLHVTFGSVLTTRVEGRYLFRERLLEALRSDEEAYYRALIKHIGRHVRPFAAK